MFDSQETGFLSQGAGFQSADFWTQDTELRSQEKNLYSAGPTPVNLVHLVTLVH